MNIQHAKKGTIRPIKPFQTIAEEAEFWDTHAATAEIDEDTIVGFHQANKTDTLTIRFSHEDIIRLREEASEQGVGPSTLARMLVKKGLQTI
jgi:predicted DNA binding CopG/RHH family protein